MLINRSPGGSPPSSPRCTAPASPRWAGGADATRAAATAVSRGAHLGDGDLRHRDGSLVPAVRGIGDSAHLLHRRPARYLAVARLRALDRPDVVSRQGLRLHRPPDQQRAARHACRRGLVLSRRVRVLRGALLRHPRASRPGSNRTRCARRAALLHPDQRRHREQESQIDEYLEEYNGPGIQHLAFLTDDLLALAEGARGHADRVPRHRRRLLPRGVHRVPNVTEDHAEIRAPQRAGGRRRGGLPAADLHQEPDRADLHRADPATEPPVVRRGQLRGAVSFASNATSSVAAI
jgi:hypothetical protein